MGRRLLLATALLGVVVGSAVGRPNGGCTTALIVSAKSAKVLRRLHVPAYSLVGDARDGWYVADTHLRHVRGNGSIDETWHSPVRRSLVYTMRFSAPGMLTRRGDRVVVAGSFCPGP